MLGGAAVCAPHWPRLGAGPGQSWCPGWWTQAGKGPSAMEAEAGRGGRAQLSLSLVRQEAREGRPVPHRARLRARHTGGGGPLPAAAQGPEPADDRRVPGQPAEAVQPRRARVSDPSPDACGPAHLQSGGGPATSPLTHAAPGTSTGAGVPPPLPQMHADPGHLQPRPAGPAPALVLRPPCCHPGCGAGSQPSLGPVLLPLLLGDGLMVHQASSPRPRRRRGFWPLGTAGSFEKACLHVLHRPLPPSPTVLRETAPCLGPVVAGWALLQALSPLHPQGVLGVHSPLHRREARASSRWLRAGVLGRDLGHGSRPAVGTVPTQALHRMDDPAGGPGTGSKHTHSFALGDTPTPWRGSLCPQAAPPTAPLLQRPPP